MIFGRLIVGTPSFLWLLVLVALATGIDLARRWGTRGQRWRGIAVRALAMIACVAALCDPRWQRRRDAGWVVFVVDRSSSISDTNFEAAMQRVETLRGGLSSDIRVGLVLADGEPIISVMPGQAWTAPDASRSAHAEATDLGGAVDLARALIPEGDAGAIVLVTDGRPTMGDRLAQSIAGRARGVPVHVVTLSPERRDPAVTSVALDQTVVRPGATLAGTIAVDGGAEPFSGKLVLRVGGKAVQSFDVKLNPAESKELPFTYSPDAGMKEGAIELDAELVRDGTEKPSARAGAALVVGSRPKVLLLTADPQDGDLIAAALRAESMDVDVRTLEAKDFPTELPKGIDLVIASNAPAAGVSGQRGMSDALLNDIAKWVDAGGGFVVLGGSRAYDLGGYAGTPIERVLPVRLDPVDPLVEPAATIVAVLDKSGSMGVPIGGGGPGGFKTKMELADEGVMASIQMLRPFDYVGVSSVTEAVTWDMTVQPVSDALDLEKKILSIRAGGGGIFVYTGLKAARNALTDATTPLRHVLLFSDCADSEEQSDRGSGHTALALADEMQKDGMTISVIGIGEETDSDTQFLKDLAQHGGGKFYLTNDATKLRALFVQETERLVDSSVQEVDFKPLVAIAHQMVKGVEYEKGPDLKAYQKLEPRKTAELVLKAPGGDPLLLTWRYGLGHVVSWMSDGGARWAKGWIDWTGYRRHWTQIARFALRTRAGGSTAVEVDFSSGQPIARLVRRDAAGLSLEGRVKMRVKTGERSQELSLSAKEPGLYEAKLDVPPDGVHTIEVVDETDTVIHEERFVVPPSEEHRYRTADATFLADLAARTAGLVDPPSITPTVKPSNTPDHMRLWPFLALFAAVLLPLDAVLRRMSRVV